jgi:hypothetical protein
MRWQCRWCWTSLSINSYKVYCSYFKMEMLTPAQWSTLQQVLSLLKLFSIMMLELSSETRAPVSKIVFIDKCIQQCSRQGTRPYDAKNMAPVAVTNRHMRANSRNCQCWTQDLENLTFSSNTKGTEVVCVQLVTNQCSWISGSATPNHEDASSLPGTISNANNAFWHPPDRRIAEQSQGHTVGADATVDMQWYLSESYKPRPQNPLIYWWCNQVRYST